MGSRPDDVDAIRNQLQQEVPDHLRATVDPRVKVNTAIPIGRIPPEILAHIFSFCVIAARSHNAPSNFKEAPRLRWLAVTQVCHSWREVALATATLWTDIRISTDVTNRVGRFLEFSGQALIDVYIGTHGPEWTSSIREVFLHINRIRSLEIFAFNLESFKKIRDQVPPAAPALRAARFSCIASPHADFSFSPTDFSAPFLSSLELRGLAIAWESNPFPLSLTRLHVTCSLDQSDTTRQCPIVAETIGHLHALEYLELRGVFPQFPISTVSLPLPASTVMLPKLKDIDISGCALSCVYFLDHLVFLPSTTITVNFTSSFSERNVSLLLPPLLRKLNTNAADTPFVEVEILFFGLRIFRTDPAQASTCACSPHFTVSLQGLSVNLRRPLVSLCARLPIQNCLTLSISSISYVPPDHPSWAQLFMAMANTRFIIIAYRAVISQSVSELLQLRITNAESAQKPTFVMPKLERLTFREVPFRDPDDDSSNFVTRLCKALTLRKKEGLGLQSIEIKKCWNMDGKDVSLLQQLVSVAWDNDVYFYHMSDLERRLDPRYCSATDIS